MRNGKVQIWFIDEKDLRLRFRWGTVQEGTGCAFVRGQDNTVIFHPREFFAGSKKEALEKATANLLKKADDMEREAAEIRALALRLR